MHLLLKLNAVILNELFLILSFIQCILKTCIYNLRELFNLQFQAAVLYMTWTLKYQIGPQAR